MATRYWAAVLVLGVLGAPAARADLAIENIQMCHGPIGPERKGADLTPYDDVWFRFNVVGARVDATGNADAGVRLQVVNDKGQMLLDKEVPVKGAAALGGNQFPGTANITLSNRLPSGDYTLTVTVIDKLARASTSFQRKLTARDGGLAIVAPQFFYDADAKVPAAAGGVVGQTLHLRLKAVGFDRSQGKIDTEMKVQVFDSLGRDTMPKPLSVVLKVDEPRKVEKVATLDFKTWLALSRAGTFRLRITLTDRLGKQTAQFETPLRVAAP